MVFTNTRSPLSSVLSLSPQRHIPILKFNNEEYYPWRLRSLIKNILRDRHKAPIHVSPFSVQLKYGHAKLLLQEWSLWNSTYLPSFSLQGKTVLDVGAGCGETALLFFLQGARKVICVEANRSAAKLITRNAANNNWDVEVFAEPFNLSHIKYALNQGAAYMKIDCEGGEDVLLQLVKIPIPATIEVHGAKLIQQFLRKFRELHVAVSQSRDLTILTTQRNRQLRRSQVARTRSRLSNRFNDPTTVRRKPS